MTNEYVVKQFKNGVVCSQLVFGYGAERMGLDSEMALKLSAPFGGGMWVGETCGCVAGALLALGLDCGFLSQNDQEDKEAMLLKMSTFYERFREKHGSLICKEILGYNPSIPEEREIIMDKNLMFTKCPQLVCDACEILDDLLDE